MVYPDPFFNLVYLPWSYLQVNSKIMRILGIVFVSLQKVLSHLQQVNDYCFCFTHFKNRHLRLVYLRQYNLRQPI